MQVDESVALNIASVPRRLLASALNACVVLPPVIATGAGGALVYVKLFRREREREHDPLKPESSSALVQRPAFRVGTSIVSCAVEVRMRNWRGPGQRLLGLRRVDARTGDPVTVGQALLHFAVTTAWSELIRRISAPSQRRRLEQLRALRDPAREVRHADAGDRNAEMRAAKERYQGQGLRPLRSCAPGVALPWVMDLPALPPLHQSLADRAAGIAVIKV
jgi:hypothetical protein